MSCLYYTPNIIGNVHRLTEECDAETVLNEVLVARNATDAVVLPMVGSGGSLESFSRLHGGYPFLKIHSEREKTF